MNCITNANDIFIEMNKLTLETRRYLIGKYNNEKTYETDFSKVIPKCNKNICHLKFNFTISGHKCYWCNTMCLLTDDGEIISGDPIHIKSGTYKNQSITINKYPIPEIEFGTYKPINTFIDSHINKIRKIVSRQRMINQCDDYSHDIAISSIINSENLPFKSRSLGAWVCDNINILKINPKLGNFNTCIFTSEIMKSTFFQIFVLSATETFSHGSPSSFNMYISDFPVIFPIDKIKKINMTTTLFFDTSIYSSYIVDYNNRSLYFVGKHSVLEIEEPKWNINFIFGLKDGKDRKGENLTKSPCMKEYLEERILTILPSKEIMNYIRMTGINIFPQLYFFIYMTIVLLNRSFYENFIKTEALNIFKRVFIELDYIKYIDMINSHIGEYKSTDDIIELLYENKIRIRHDIFNIIKNDILNYMLN